MTELAIVESLEAQVEKKYQDLELVARENLKEALANPHYTGPQKTAMVQFAMLKDASLLDLPVLMVKGRILDDIHRMALWTQMPGNYKTEEEAVEDLGKLSRSEQSNIKDLNGVIFPFAEKYLGMSKAEFFSSFRNKSNLRELVPYMKAIITGEASHRASVNDAVLKLQARAGTTSPDEVIESIIELGSAEPNKALRQYLRPVEPFNAVLMRRNGASYFLAEIPSDETDRIMSSTMFVVDQVDLDEYAPGNVPSVRRMMGTGA